MLDTDQLRSFIAIVDTGSFTRAGERVNKTQSAVSMHIRRLEQQLGCALFVRQGRSARLTTEGERLIEFARRMIQVEAGAMAAISRKGLNGAVRLGIPDDYAEAKLWSLRSVTIAKSLANRCRLERDGNHPHPRHCMILLEAVGQGEGGAAGAWFSYVLLRMFAACSTKLTQS